MGALSVATLVLSAHAAVPPPELQLAWRGEQAQLTVAVAEGFHVAADAPLSVELRLGELSWSLHTLGAAAAGLPLALPTTRPLLVDGRVEMSICTDDGSLCQPVAQDLRAVLESRRGETTLDVVPPVAAAEPAEPDQAFEAALTAASASGRPVLLDFGAVWCPPCNLLAAEVLHASAHAELLETVELVEIDVDEAHSWVLKDRYDVGGYPTVVAVDGSGAVLDRLVGYPGAAQTVAWIEGLGQTTPLSAAPPPAELSAAEAGAWALRLVQGQQEEAAAPYLARARTGGSLTGDGLLAQVILAPTATTVLAAAEAGAPLADWVWSAWSIKDSPEVAALLDRELHRAMASAPPVAAADYFYALAGLAPDPALAADRALAGATVLSGSLTGDLERDRGHLGFLARLWEKAGQVDTARQVLDAALARWPADMTFHEDRAALELRQGALDPALAHAQQAVEHGYGDNRLRAAALLVEVLQARGEQAEAEATISRMLTEAVRPPEELQVRTGRYLDRLEALRSPEEDPQP